MELWDNNQFGEHEYRRQKLLREAAQERLAAQAGVRRFRLWRPRSRRVTPVACG